MVVIQINSGKIRGKGALDKNNNQFYSFQNIPYAEPPLGKLRFKAPRPIQPWEGVKDCTKEGRECFSRHIITKKIIGSEDCLNLNVYTPELPENGGSKSLRPVMFYIHGGIFMTGSNKTEFFGPEFLISEDIVLVTINYRLGLLGFLSLDDPSLGVPGNTGFKDMVLALKWVQRNIANFSGDPNNVTVFGESAGGAAAHLLMLSPMTKGLLHKVIAQSAGALNGWVPGRRSARVVAKKLGFSNTDDRKLLSFLQSVPVLDLLKAQMKSDLEDFVEYNFRLFGVVIERPSEEEAFLCKDPIEIMLSGDYNHVPLMMGYNFREGIAVNETVPKNARKNFFENMEISVPLVLNVQRGSELSKEIAEKIRLFYYGDGERDRQKHAIQYFDLVTDTSFMRDVYFAVKYHITTSIKPIYFYKMILETELNIMKKIAGATAPGVYHGDDLGYLFKTIFTPEIIPGSIEDISQKRITRLWTNFARYGDPTPDPHDHLLGIKWKPITTDTVHYLEIGEELKMKENPEKERMAFWEKIYGTNPMASKL